MKNEIKLLIAFSLGVALIFVLNYCNENKPTEPTTQTVPQAIEQEAQNKLDSIRAEKERWKSIADSLTIAFNKKEPQRKSSQGRVESSIADASAFAKAKNYDSLEKKIEDINIEFREYAYTTNEQLETQGLIIMSKDSSLKSSYAETELERGKFKKLSIAYDSVVIVTNKKIAEKDAEIAGVETKLERSDRRLRRARYVNSLAVPALVAGGVSAVAPQYAIPAVAGAAVLHLILKPKKKKK